MALLRINQRIMSVRSSISLLNVCPLALNRTAEARYEIQQRATFISSGGATYLFQHHTFIPCEEIFRPCLVPKNQKILRSKGLHRVPNVDEKILITQLGEKSRDETFEPN